MTRINAGVPPHHLTRQHLLAEHREMKRIPNVVKSGRACLTSLPQEFCMGKGHVRFFYNKLGWLLGRYRLVRDEAWSRGYQVQDFEGAWDGLPEDLLGDWQPTAEAERLVRERIALRLSQIQPAVRA